MSTWIKTSGDVIVSVARSKFRPVGNWVQIPDDWWQGWESGPAGRHVPFITQTGVSWRSARTLELAKTEKRSQIDAWRLAANRSGFTYQGKLVATDELSMLDISNTNGEIARAGAMPANWPGGWKAQGQIIPISTVEQWGSFFSAMFQQGLANFNKSQALKAQVDAAQTIEQVDAITWESS